MSFDVLDHTRIAMENWFNSKQKNKEIAAERPVGIPTIFMKAHPTKALQVYNSFFYESSFTRIKVTIINNGRSTYL